jgi:predicted component of type VI protein secretion system
MPMAQALDAFAFAKHVGPFVLLERPVKLPKAPTGKNWATSTAPLPATTVREELEPIELPELFVATLPPPQKDGTLELTLGRAADCDVLVDDPSVSQKHAAILWDGKTGLLRELGSTNGTFLNGIKLGSRAPLRTGDDVSVGRSHFVYMLTTDLHVKLLKVK